MKKYVVRFFFLAVILLFVGSCQNQNAKLPQVQDTLGDSRCTLIPETGPCKALFERYYFGATEKICKKFVWGGCDGVVPFETLDSCQEVCEEQ